MKKFFRVIGIVILVYCIGSLALLGITWGALLILLPVKYILYPLLILIGIAIFIYFIVLFIRYGRD